MDDSLVKKEDSPIRAKDASIPELLFPWARMNPFFEFRHTVVTVSHSDGKTRVKALENRFVDGKLESEEFEGVTGAGLYENAMKQICSAYLENMFRVMQSFRLFNPFMPFAPKDDQIE